MKVVVEVRNECDGWGERVGGMEGGYWIDGMSVLGRQRERVESVDVNEETIAMGRDSRWTYRFRGL